MSELRKCFSSRICLTLTPTRFILPPPLYSIIHVRHCIIVVKSSYYGPIIVVSFILFLKNEKHDTRVGTVITSSIAVVNIMHLYILYIL